MINNIVIYSAAAYQWGLLIYVLSSWFRHELADKARFSLSGFYEKPLKLIQDKLVGFGLNPQIDLSPLVLYFLVSVARNLLVF